jgi:hypothetical protein
MKEGTTYVRKRIHFGAIVARFLCISHIVSHSGFASLSMASGCYFNLLAIPFITP